MIEYLFDEESSPMPGLGVIQTRLGKLTLHRRLLMPMLFDYYETDRLIICMVSNNRDLMRDLFWTGR